MSNGSTADDPEAGRGGSAPVVQSAEPSDRGAPARPGPSRRAVAAGAVLLAALLGAAWWLHHQFTHVLVDDARVATDMVAISSRVPGWAVDVRVISGDVARRGDLLVSIDDRDTRLLLQELDARLAGVARRRDELLARIRMIDLQTAGKMRAQDAAVDAAQAGFAAARTREGLAQVEAGRFEKLAPIGAVGRDQLDQARAALETAGQQVRSAMANLESSRAGVAQAQADREQLTVLRHQVAGLDPEEVDLRAQRERALLDLRDRAVSMPFDGVIDRTFVNAGEYVSAGQRLLLVHDPQAVRVEANVKETDIRHFRPGKKVRIVVDALPGQAFEGTVIKVGQAATSEFALLPNPNPSGNFTKITQRLPVRIAVRQQDGLLKPGMMVEVEATAGD